MELITYYTSIQKSLTSLASGLKDADGTEKRERESLNDESEREKRKKYVLVNINVKPTKAQLN